MVVRKQLAAATSAAQAGLVGNWLMLAPVSAERASYAPLIFFAVVFVVLLAGGLLLYLVQVGGTPAMAVAEASLKHGARTPKGHEPSLRAQ